SRLTAGEHVVADGNLLVDLCGDQALVDALVAAAEQHQAIQAGQLAHPGLVQPATLGTEVDHVRRLRIRLANGAKAGQQRLDHHHHAGPAAEGAVVDLAVVAFRMIARVPAMHREQAALDRPAGHAERGALGDELGEQRDDIDAHQKSGSQSTVIVPASKSTDFTNCGSTKGSIRSRSPCTTSTSLAPVASRCDTVPRSTPSRVMTRRPSRSTQ